VPRRKLALDPGLFGDLRVEELRDERLKRCLRVARLTGRSRPVGCELLSALLDAQLLWMSADSFTLTRFERVAEITSPVECVQAWWCRTTTLLNWALDNRRDLY
jgi:hypothetical protein